MDVTTLARRTLLTVEGTVAVTAVAGGAALCLGALAPSLASVVSPPLTYLEGSPFTSYLVPGLLLAFVLGGIHATAFMMLLRRQRWGLLAGAVAGFTALIWIFVQMVFIPFSFLQVLYFAAGLAEVGLVMVLLGLFSGRVADSAHGQLIGAGR